MGCFLLKKKNAKKGNASAPAGGSGTADGGSGSVGEVVLFALRKVPEADVNDRSVSKSRLEVPKNEVWPIPSRNWVTSIVYSAPPCNSIEPLSLNGSPSSSSAVPVFACAPLENI